VFLASIALNVFLIAVIGAHVVSHWHGGRDRRVELRIDRIAATLPADDADKLRAIFMSRLGEIQAASDSYQRAQDVIGLTLTTEPFDPAALRIAMADARAKRLALEVELQDVLASTAAQMSGEGRAKLAEWPRTH